MVVDVNSIRLDGRRLRGAFNALWEYTTKRGAFPLTRFRAKGGQLKTTLGLRVKEKMGRLQCVVGPHDQARWAYPCPGLKLVVPGKPEP